MSPQPDSPSNGSMHVNRVAQAKGLSAGFDYGDQENGDVTGAAYHFNQQENILDGVNNNAVTAPAPVYNPSGNTSENEGEATILQEEVLGLMANAGSAEDASEGNNANNTGLPNDLKAGLESLSGFSLDNVNVHYNSSKPAQLNAHAYAQGMEIHLGSGQEKHLPHEAWHVVQQMQGRVQPTAQLKGKVNVNNNSALEKEADVMGAKALRTTSAKSNYVKTDKSISETVVQKKPFGNPEPSHSGLAGKVPVCSENEMPTGPVVDILRPIANVMDQAVAMGEWEPDIIADLIRKDFDQINAILKPHGFDGDSTEDDAVIVDKFRTAVRASGSEMTVRRSRHMQANGHVTEPMNPQEYERYTDMQEMLKQIDVLGNISGGIFGALGYGLAGDIGSELGAVLDTGLSGFKGGFKNSKATSKTAANLGPGKANLRTKPTSRQKAKNKSKRKDAKNAKRKNRQRKK